MYADELLTSAMHDKFKSLELHSYLRPATKWVTEELVYKLTKKIFKDYHVIYQYRPFFLKSSFGGQMSYDVYISGLKIAIEYQGQQHFEPIDFFGGIDGFNKLIIRDAEKLKLSKANGIKLVYINYWEEVTEALIKKRINEEIEAT